MARLRHRSEWFTEIDPKVFYESEFEAIILQNVDLLSENAILVPFKRIVFSSPFESKRADLALIDRDYRFWWVIEVELASHDLLSHVIPQVRVLVDGRYGDDHADALASQNADLDRERLTAMMRGEPPSVVVISNRFDPRWDRELAAIGATYTVFNIFRSDRNNDIFLFDGKLPRGPGAMLTRLVPYKGMPRFFRVLSPGALPEPAGGKLPILLEGRRTSWTRYEIKDQCLIGFNGREAVRNDRSYILELLDDGSLLMRDEGE